jgi:hypothetical protein
MAMIDKQRITAVRKLEGMGYTFADGDWMRAANDAIAPVITDDLHALLVKRTDELAGCTERSAEEGELAAITDAPLGRSEWVVYAKRPFGGPEAVLA